MPLREGILDPISEAEPCGKALVNDATFERLKDLRKPNEQAIEAFYAPKSGSGPRIMTADLWMPREINRVIEIAGTLLATKSKDLQVAVWLAEAMLWKEGLGGFREGLDMVREMLERYWDTLHPLPDEGDQYLRIRHLEWMGMTESVKESSPPLALGFVPFTQGGLTWNQFKESRDVPGEKESGKAAEKRKAALADGKTPPEDFEDGLAATPKAVYKKWAAEAEGCLQSLAALDQLCREKFSDDPPGFLRLRTGLEELQNGLAILLRRKLEQDPDPPEIVEVPEAPAAEGPAGEDGEAPASGGAALSMGAQFGDLTGIEPGSREEAFFRIAAAANYLRRTDPANPASYLAMRGVRWGELYAAEGEIPPALLSAPPTEIRTKLRNLAARADWRGVLDTAEGAMAMDYGRGWLDLQRYAVRACEELGHKRAAAAIRSLIKRLLADYPALGSATLTDDTGAANPETAAWLKQIQEGG
ncbi:MAG: type VI secretion system protein TssA [Bryobacteraceae bacterium]